MRIVSWTNKGILQINTEEHILTGDDVESARKVYSEGKLVGIKFRTLSSPIYFDDDIKPIYDSENGSKIIGIRSKYSQIVIYGQTRPRLKIPKTYVDNNGVTRPYKRGWKHLTAIYSDDFKEYYLGTLRRTLVYYGRKVWINCPTIYYQDNFDTELLLKADLFTFNRRVPGGEGYFKYHYQRISPFPVEVVRGYAEEGFDIVPSNGVDYEFYYKGSEKYELSDAEGKGYIYKFTVPKGKIPLVVDVPTIITNRGDTCQTKLVARVHRKYKEPQDYIKRTDIPEGGYITFYVDGKIISYNGKTHWKISTSGYATVPFNPDTTWAIGTHNIVAVYTPNTPELQRKYIETSGSGTLFIGTDGNRPCFTSSDPWCTFMGNDNKSLTFRTDKKVNGQVQLYIDGELVHLKGSSSPDYKVNISAEANKTFTISFDTLGKVSQNGYHWMYGGYHNIMLCYSIQEIVTMADEDELGNPRTEIMPMEYWYYFKDFYIQIPTDIELLHEDDINKYGNNIFYLDEDGNTVIHHIPTDREKSLSVGTPLKVRVIDIENRNQPVQGGYVRLTWVSRSENDNMEETTNNLW